ncbi:hypothetical protein FQA39_LY07407 [Lamprigera yunnana]|nr:hypothetical protein FQA39_LY07407 [Lamprigera yunnana]
MSLPVSQYEALLVEVRNLRRKAVKVQQLVTPLLGNDFSFKSCQTVAIQENEVQTSCFSFPLSVNMDPILGKQINTLKVGGL